MLRSLPEYGKLRETVMRRDNYACKNCGSTTRLQMHHIIMMSKNIKLAFDKANCVILCTKCHNGIHSKLINKILRMANKKKKSGN